MSVTDGSGIVLTIRKDPGFADGWHRIHIENEDMSTFFAQIESELVRKKGIKKGSRVRYTYEDEYPGYIRNIDVEVS